MIDTVKYPVIYSVATLISYEISSRYYHNVHYVWCTTSLNDLKQPPTSRPNTISKRLLEIVTTGDRHATEIKNNKLGILKGANIKLLSNVIDNAIFDEISSYVAHSRYEAFFPVLYIIYTDKIKHKCVEVDKEERASDESIEYIIESLEEGDFDILSYKDILKDVVSAADRKAGI